MAFDKAIKPILELLVVLIGIGGLIVGWYAAKSADQSAKSADQSAKSADQAAKAADQQVKAAEEANARLAGKVPAKLKFEGCLPDATTLPLTGRKSIFGSTLNTFYSDDPKKLIALNHHLILRNVGDDPIDAIRVTVSVEGSQSEKELFNFLRSDDSQVIQQIYRDDQVLDRKMSKNDIVKFPITKGLLHQMLQAQKPTDKGMDRFGNFRVQWFGRIVGSTSFDMPVDDIIMHTRVLWLPERFPEEPTAKLIGEIVSRVEVLSSK